MGHEIVWLARYEGLKVVLMTISYNSIHVFLNAHPGLRHSFFMLGVRVVCLYEKLTEGRTRIFPFWLFRINTRLLYHYWYNICWQEDRNLQWIPMVPIHQVALLPS